MNIVNSFDRIKQEIKNNKIQYNTEIIAVSKTFPLEHIKPLVDHGHRHFGENKVQEAEKKWSELKKSMIDLKLHMIGRLQSNKAKKAVELFDYIHSLDSQKLADVLATSQQNINKLLEDILGSSLSAENDQSLLEKSFSSPLKRFEEDEREATSPPFLPLPRPLPFWCSLFFISTRL